MNRNLEWTESEQPALELFRKLGYRILEAGPGESPQTIGRNTPKEVILRAEFEAALQRLNPRLSPANLRKAAELIYRLPPGDALLRQNRFVHDYLRSPTFHAKEAVGGREEFIPVTFIDFKHPERNDFAIGHQQAFAGRGGRIIPDLTVYVNGLPLAVIECKAPAAGSRDAAISDLRYYQDELPRLFAYNQLCVALWGDGGKYGAVAATDKYYHEFPAESTPGLSALLGGDFRAQDRLVWELFRPAAFVDFVRHFVIFEDGQDGLVKKVPRWPQLRATNKAVARLRDKDRGGVIWHTQGSGKSLTMAYIAKKLRAPEYGFENPTVLILTDRIDLDGQISNTFSIHGLGNIYRASSTDSLQQLLRNGYGSIVTSTIQKFDPNTQADEEEEPEPEKDEDLGKDRAERIRRTMDGDKILVRREVKVDGQWQLVEEKRLEIEELSEKKNLYVMVDEAHRTQYGMLAAYMRRQLPHAKFLAFTGTPLTAEEKSTLAEFYGGEYLDVYTFRQAIQDGATVDIYYQLAIEQMGVRKQSLDAQFNEKFGRESGEKQEALKKEGLDHYEQSEVRIENILRHLLEHYTETIFPLGLKAMIVTDGRQEARTYRKVLERLRAEGLHNYDSRAVVSLGSRKEDFLRAEMERDLQYNREYSDAPRPIYLTPPHAVQSVANAFKLPFGDPDDTGRDGRVRYNNVAFLIVSDMLLTGYDVPVVGCMYLDKSLQSHTLLQAIARVNRKYKDKPAGFLVDYRGIKENLRAALDQYSSEEAPEEVLKDMDTAREELQRYHSALVGYFAPVNVDRKTNPRLFTARAIEWLEPEDRRDLFRLKLRQFDRALAILLPSPEALVYRDDCVLFHTLLKRLPRDAAGRLPRLDSEESRTIRAMVDAHLEEEGIRELLATPQSLENFEALAELPGTTQRTREKLLLNNLRHRIRTGEQHNPLFYKPLGQALEDLINRQAGEQLDLTVELEKLRVKIVDEEGRAGQLGFTTKYEVAVFQALQAQLGAEEAQRLTPELLDAVAGYMEQVEWWRKDSVGKDMGKAIRKKLRTLGHGATATQRANELLQLLQTQARHA